MNALLTTNGAILATSAYWDGTGLMTLLIAVVANTACALLGCYLVLRRMSMMGDALSHAVLPGLAVAFIFSGSYAIGPLFLGAIAAGLLTTFLSQSLHQYARVPSDASMGAVFTSMFALGVVLIKVGVRGHFDMACVYEGNLVSASIYTMEIAGWEIPRALATVGPVLLINLGVVLLFWKELQLSSFDSALATTMGFSATLLHYVLMALVALTAVASFEAVGSILVVAMLIVPAATAHLLADRLAPMMGLSVLFACLASLIGYVLGVYFDSNFAGMMSIAAGGLYALTVIFSPSHGLLTASLRNLQMSLRVIREDILAMLYRVEELDANQTLSATGIYEAIGDGWLYGILTRVGLARLVRHGRVAREGGQVRLTDVGRDAARKLVRGHRLWENYLVEQLGLPLDHVHEPAHRVEHYLDESIREKLEQKLDAPTRDPHGREIPE